MAETSLPTQEIDAAIGKARQLKILLKEVDHQLASLSMGLPLRYTPEQVAAQYHVVPSTVTRWIKRGQLGALDLTEDESRSRRYAIRPEDLEAFEAVRHTIRPGRKKVIT